ncbi:MAG: hypothetical protein HZB92_00260 [Euryarchaeota archaeon]|nr:hypothetical protein [Euryarchaeota archaeon]
MKPSEKKDHPNPKRYVLCMVLCIPLIFAIFVAYLKLEQMNVFRQTNFTIGLLALIALSVIALMFYFALKVKIIATPERRFHTAVLAQNGTYSGVLKAYALHRLIFRSWWLELDAKGALRTTGRQYRGGKAGLTEMQFKSIIDKMGGIRAIEVDLLAKGRYAMTIQYSNGKSVEVMCPSPEAEALAREFFSGIIG